MNSSPEPLSKSLLNFMQSILATSALKFAIFFRIWNLIWPLLQKKIENYLNDFFSITSEQMSLKLHVQRTCHNGF